MPLASSSGRGPRRRWLVIALVIACAAIATAGTWWWHEPNLVKRVQSGLPVQPALTGKPAVLVEQLAKAQAGTTSSKDALASVVELGRLYHINGFNREAAACWNLLQSEQPNVARWCYYLADLQRSASDYAAMESLLLKTTHLAPDYAPAWLLLASLQFKTGQLDAATRNYQKRLQLVPGDPYARLWLARIALQGGRQTEARELIEKLVNDSPDFSSGHNLYAEMLSAAGDATGAQHQRWLGRETGRYREADDPWLEELKDWCYDYEQLCAFGTLAYQIGQHDRARSYFERAIRIRPEAPAGYDLLGALYLKQHEPAKARDTLEQSAPFLKNSKPSLEHYLSLSQAYRDLKQKEDAVRVVREGLRQLGPNLDLYSSLGTALGDLGQSGEALAAFQQALALNPNHTETNFNLGLLLLNLGRQDEAITALKRSLILQPTFPNALTLLGRVELDAGRWEAAEVYLRPVIESHPEITEARQLMAHWYFRTGSAAEAKKDAVTAERYYGEGLKLNPNHADLQVSLGILRLMQARFADAREPLEAYHRLQPDNPQSCLFLGQVYAATGRIDEARRLLAKGADLADKAGNRVTANHCREILRDL